MFELRPETLPLDEPLDPAMDDAEGKMLLDEAIQELGLQELPKEYFNPNHQPAGSEKGGEFAPKAGGGGTSTDTPAFKKWFGDSKVVDENGDPLVVYHGGTHDKSEFDVSKASPESDWGAGIYFSDNADDAGGNYTSPDDPDLMSKIGNLVYELSASGKYGPEVDLEEVARGMILGGHPNIMPVYLSMQNPFVLGDNEAKGSKETYIGGEYVSGKLNDLVGALAEVADDFESDDSAKSGGQIVREWAGKQLNDYMGEGISASKFMRAFNENEDFSYLYDDEGKHVGAEILRRALEKVGFDGVIDHTVSRKWPGMEGMNQQTSHYIIFRPEQVKSKFNKGTFDPKDKRVSYAQRAKTTYERRVDFKLAKHRLDATETRVKERLKAQLRQVQDSLIAWTQITTLDSNTVRYLPVASLPEFQRTLQDMFEQAWTHGRDAGVKELPRKVKKRPSLQAVRTFAWDYCPCWSDGPEWHQSAVDYAESAVDYAEWDESKHPRSPKGSEKGGEFAPGDFHVARPDEPVGANNPRIKIDSDNPSNVILYHVTKKPGLVQKGGIKKSEPGVIRPAGFQAVFFAHSPSSALAKAKYEEELRQRVKGIKPSLGDFWVVEASVPKAEIEVRTNGDIIVRRDVGKTEVKRILSLKDVKNFADEHSYANAFEPTEAMKAFENRAWMIKDVIDSRLQSAVRQELFEHLKGGRTMGDTIQRLRDIFAPYVGDPSKVEPGGKSLLSASRLENIVRTETTWAYNQGRLAVGDALGDYILGYQFSAILDERTTEICQTADGLVLQKDDATTIQLTPPLHFQCRSMLVYVTADDVPVEWSDDKEIDAAVSLIQAGFK